MPGSYYYPPTDYAAQCTPYVNEVAAMLDRWTAACDEREAHGTPIPWQADPRGVTVSEETAQKLVDIIQKHFWTLEVWLTREGTDGGPYTHGPDLHRLSYPERLAMIQEWSAIKRKHAVAEARRKADDAKRQHELEEALAQHPYVGI